MKNPFKRKAVVPLDAEVSAQLRAVAEWPQENHGRGGYRSRARHITIVRDQFGNVINSVEHLDEEEFEEYSDQWGK